MSSNRPKLGVYAAVFVALQLLLALSAVLGILKISGWTGFVSGLGIAAVKTLLIAVFFMHLGSAFPFCALLHVQASYGG